MKIKTERVSFEKGCHVAEVAHGKVLRIRANMRSGVADMDIMCDDDGKTQTYVYCVMHCDDDNTDVEAVVAATGTQPEGKVARIGDMIGEWTYPSGLQAYAFSVASEKAAKSKALTQQLPSV